MVRYLYDGSRVIEEEEQGDTASSYVYGRGVDEVLAMRRGGAYYYYPDDLGSVMALGDASGVVLERYDYLDYGAPRIGALV